jgi:hypothetical protein
VASEWGQRRGFSLHAPPFPGGTEAREEREAREARGESTKGICAQAEARPGQERAGRLACGRSTSSGEEARKRCGGGDGDGDGNGDGNEDRVEGS